MGFSVDFDRDGLFVGFELAGLYELGLLEGRFEGPADLNGDLNGIEVVFTEGVKVAFSLLALLLIGSNIANKLGKVKLPNPVTGSHPV